MKALRFVPMLVLLSAGTASAATFTVTTTDDTGDGSLRDALTQAAASTGPHTITITATGTIAVTSTLPTVVQPTTITGPGAASLTIQGGTFTLISSQSDFAVSGVTLSGISSTLLPGIRTTERGTLAFTDVTFTGNTAGPDGIVRSQVPIVVTRCLFTGNSSSFGLLFLNGGTQSKILETTFIDNTGTAIMYASNSVLTIERSTFTNNRGSQGVGGILLQGGTANIFNSTFSGNTGPQASDFFSSNGSVVFNLTNVTAHGGSAPSVGNGSAATTVNARNTIFSGAGARCARAIASKGHNLSSDGMCGLTAAGDLETTDPLLGPLADNGGATPSHMMRAGSPALAAGDSADLISDVDQRGLPRLSATTVDIGAIEAAPPTITTQPAAQDVAEGAALTLTVVATNPNSAAAVTYQWRKDGADIAGATADTYAVADALAGDAGSYDVVVRNELLGVTSAPAAVTVAPGDGGDGGGCCNVPGAPAGSTLALAAVVLGLVIRRRRT